VHEGVSPLQSSRPSTQVVRLTGPNGSHVEMINPKSPGDTLTGIHKHKCSPASRSRTSRQCDPRVSAGKTIGLFVGLSAVVVGIAVIACLASPSGPCNGN